MIETIRLDLCIVKRLKQRLNEKEKHTKQRGRRNLCVLLKCVTGPPMLSHVSDL